MLNNQGQDPKNQQWAQNPMMSMGGNPMGGQQGLNPGQIPQNPMMQQMGPGQGQMPGGPIGMGMPPMNMMPNKGDRGFMGNNMGMPNPGGNFIHPANVAQNEQGGYRK